MAEFIFKKEHYVNADPEKDRRGTHKKGDLINWKPDGWAANWPDVGKYADKFVCVSCPEITLTEAEAADHRRPWRDDFDYEVISASQSNVTLRVWNKNQSPTGRAGLTIEKVEDFLTRWGCTNISFANRSVTFTFNLWNAVRSIEFWDVELIGTKVNFTLVSYNTTSRIGRIQIAIVQENWGEMKKVVPKEELVGLNHPIWIIDEQVVIDGKIYFADEYLIVWRFLTQTEIEEKITKQVIQAIESKGGTIISNTYPMIAFEIERNAIANQFRQELKQKTEQVFKRHQYSISEALVDQIIASGGIITMTRSELLAAIINHLES